MDYSNLIIRFNQFSRSENKMMVDIIRQLIKNNYPSVELTTESCPIKKRIKCTFKYKGTTFACILYYNLHDQIHKILISLHNNILLSIITIENDIIRNQQIK
jgi:hypothetical protein